MYNVLHKQWWSHTDATAKNLISKYYETKMEGAWHNHCDTSHDD
jgi:hypothetical protein